MDSTRKLLLANKAWAQSKRLLDPHYFAGLAQDQKPDYLWVGCSDSRVPPSDITGTDPGEMFVHRNIANQVAPDDLNFLSVVQYAVVALKIKHIIVCGHYNCGGVKASFAPPPLPDVAHWIGGIGETLRRNRPEIDAIAEPDRANRLVELNVLAQLENLRQIPCIREAWANGPAPRLHGWVYDLHSGLLKSLRTLDRTD